MEDLNHEKIWHAVHQCSACGVHDGFCSPGECICPWGGGTATDPESSISTQAAVTGTVLTGGKTFHDGGEYILRGDYTQRIIIDSTDPVTINIDGNVTYTLHGNNYESTTFLEVKNVPELTINGNDGKVSGKGDSYCFLDAENTQSTMKLTVEGGTYSLEDTDYPGRTGVTCCVVGKGPDATKLTNVFLNNVTAIGPEAVLLVNCDATITGGDFCGIKDMLDEDGDVVGALDIKNGTVTIDHATVEVAGGYVANSIANDGGTVTVNGGECKGEILNSCDIWSDKAGSMTLNNVTTKKTIYNSAELTINGGTHTSDERVVYTGNSENDVECVAVTRINSGTFRTNDGSGSHWDTIENGWTGGETYIDEQGGTTLIENDNTDRAAVLCSSGTVYVNAGKIYAPNGCAIRTNDYEYGYGRAEINDGYISGKYAFYATERDWNDEKSATQINGGDLSGKEADIYLEKIRRINVGKEYSDELTVLVEDPSNGRKITMETPDAGDGSYVPYQQKLKLVSLNPGYTIGMGAQFPNSQEYRCLIAQNTVTAQNATAKADLGEDEKTLTTSDLVECGKPVTITAKAPAAPADPDADSPDTVFANWTTDNNLTINGEATGSEVNGSAEHELTFTMPSEPVSVTAVNRYKITIKGGKKYGDNAENEDGTYYYYAKAGDLVQLAFAGANGSHWSWNTAELPGGVTYATDVAPAHFTMPANAVTIEASANSSTVIPRAYRVQVQLPADVAFAEGAAPVTVSVPDTTGTVENPKPDRTNTTTLFAEPKQLVTLAFDTSALPEGYTFGQWVVTQLLPEQTTVEVTAVSDLEATFSMPASPVTVTFTVNAPVEPEPDPEPADDGGTGAVIAGALIGGTAYLLGTRAWLEGTYGYVPANRMELALGLWKRANCPAPVSTELYADIGQNDADAQAAARWCVEQGLLKDYHEQNDDGTETVTFKPGRYVARPYALTRWYQLEKLLDEQQAAQAETPAEAPAQISET